MTYFLWESPRWLSRALCRCYTLVQFGKLRIPMRVNGVLATADWHWALGLGTSGEFEVLGAWRDDGPATPQRIAADLHHRGLERVRLLVADEGLAAAMKGLPSKVCEQTVADLASPGVASSHLQQAMRWTGTAAQHLQRRMSRAAMQHGAMPDDSAAAEFLSQRFQRADRDLLVDDCVGVRPALFGLSASPLALARAA